MLIYLSVCREVILSGTRSPMVTGSVGSITLQTSKINKDRSILREHLHGMHAADMIETPIGCGIRDSMYNYLIV